MKRRDLSESGIGVVEGIIVVAVLAILALVGYLVYTDHQTKNNATTSSQTGTSDTSKTSPPPAATDVLIPADTATPAAGYCVDDSSTSSFVFTLNPDIPNPRCQKLYPGQSFGVVNNTGESIDITIGSYTTTLAANTSKQFEDLKLAAGVHDVKVSHYAGSGPEVWVQP